MKYLKLFAVFVSIISCTNPKNNNETIKVSGEGKVKVKPDLVILTINVSFTQPRMADAVRLTQETIDSVNGILLLFQKKEDDIKSSHISANKEYNYNTNRPVFIGYQAEQSIDFVLNDISRFTELTGKLLETKIRSISSIEFGHSKADSLFREADLLAYDDALQSARKLCERANVRLGKIVYISNADEESISDYSDGSMGERINTFSKGYGGRGFKISPQVLEFKRYIISEYLIE